MKDQQDFNIYQVHWRIVFFALVISWVIQFFIPEIRYLAAGLLVYLFLIIK